MIGMALEGGGARGAYHIGVVSAYLEAGYRFDGFVGTSVGAINGALLAQGDLGRAEELWKELSTERLFDEDEQILIRIGESRWDIQILTDLRNSVRKVIDSGGVDTSRIEALVGQWVDEDKLRAAGRDFGLVTVSLHEHKPYELFLEDIPPGRLLQYIMASACFPGFRSQMIDGHAYIDGALHNNCPVNMLLKKGYDRIIAVRTRAPGVFRRLRIPAGVRVTIIEPDEDLGNVMVFSPERTAINIELGYLDGRRALRAG